MVEAVLSIGLMVDVGIFLNDLDSTDPPSFNCKGFICTNASSAALLFERPDVMPRILNCASLSLIKTRTVMNVERYLKRGKECVKKLHPRRQKETSNFLR